MASASSSGSSDPRLALALLATLAVGCGGGSGGELRFTITGAATCGVTCVLQGVDVYVLKPVGSSYCVFASRSFVPTGERELESLDLEAGTTVRLVILGFCGPKCECRYDDRVVIDPAAGSLSIKLGRTPFCEKPTYLPCD